uniref:FRIGIDA-like protein n=1 Tax=Oryza meridionalis TaxID=40149 RepID=A0A0E0F3R8_9ORYZ
MLIDELKRMRAPLATALAEELSSRPAHSPSAVASSSSFSVDLSIEDLLALIYFGSLFDIKPQTEFVATMLVRAKERDCCLTFDYRDQPKDPTK